MSATLTNIRTMGVDGWTQPDRGLHAVVLTLGAGDEIRAEAGAMTGDREEVKRDLGGTLGKIGDLIGGDS